VAGLFDEVRCGEAFLPASVAQISRLGMDALPDLLSGVEDPNPNVRLVALRAILSLAPNAAARSDEVMTKLIKALADPNYEVRFATVTVIGRCGPNRANAVPALIEALADRGLESEEDWDFFRIAIVYILGRIGPKAEAAVPPLTSLLDERSHSLCQQAALALWRISRNPALPVAAMAKMLDDPDPGAQLLAAVALRRINQEVPLAPELAAKLDLVNTHSCH
jgi:HEAT repeat protein